MLLSGQQAWEEEKGVRTLLREKRGPGRQEVRPHVGHESDKSESSMLWSPWALEPRAAGGHGGGVAGLWSRPSSRGRWMGSKVQGSMEGSTGG